MSANGLRRLAAGAGIVAGVSLGCVAYGTFVEARAFQLRRFDVPVLPAGAAPIRILHVSDIHLVPGQHAKRRWLAGLAALEPDLVVDTGDNHASIDADPALLESLGRLLDRPGAFVWGSNDYTGPAFKNPLSYLSGRRKDLTTVELPWRELKASFEARGWVDLTHARHTLTVHGVTIELRGVDDAHMGADRYETVAGPASPAADVSIGVMHAPYLRTLDAMTADGVQLMIAGHTHGGQVCVPGYGALITNCDLDTRRVKGLSRHTAAGRESWLEVSAGLGMSPFAPYRFACPPEATLLTLVPAAGRDDTNS